MGCDGTPIVNFEHSYSICTMTINNLTDELIKIYPLPYDRILACSCRNYKILDMNEEKEKKHMNLKMKYLILFYGLIYPQVN